MISFKQKKVSSYHKIAFAKVDYSRENELFEFLSKKKIALNQLSSFSNQKRKIEWMTIRYLLEKTHDIPDEVIYNDHGKPFFLKSKSHLSISHSHDMVAISINEKSNTGIDIQLISNKIIRIKHKFLSKTELANVATNTEELTLYWSSKEALFKVYGKKDAYLKENMQISDLQFNGKVGSASGLISTEHIKSRHHIKLERFENYVLAYVVNS